VFAARRKPAERSEAKPMLNATGAKTRVIIVEDDPDAREIYLGTLSYAGYDVTTATSVAEAKRAARRHSPHLVVLDSRLPDGRGTDLLKILKRCPEMSGVPILMVTAFAGEQDVQARESRTCKRRRSLEQTRFCSSPCADHTAFPVPHRDSVPIRRQ
jgi:CheY-like chemotaxis protein